MSTESTELARNRGGIQVINRAAEILRTLNGEQLGLTPSEVARRVALSRSTVHRILVALEGEGFVSAGSTPGRYRLGPELSRLAASERGELRFWVRPFLEKLSNELNETVDLAVLIQDRVSFVDQVAAPHRLRAVSTIGATFPAWCTANGKALLATLSDDHLLRLLPEHLRSQSSQVELTRDELLEELHEVRRTGVAFDREEHTAGISAIGAVVRDPFVVVAAVTVVLPSMRLEGNEERITSALLTTCAEITEMLSGSAAVASGPPRS